MAKQNPLQHIMSKPLTRKEFLQHVGLMILALFGVTQVMNHLLHADKLASGKATGTRWGGGKFGV